MRSSCARRVPLCRVISKLCVILSLFCAYWINKSAQLYSNGWFLQASKDHCPLVFHLHNNIQLPMTSCSFCGMIGLLRRWLPVDWLYPPFQWRWGFPLTAFCAIIVGVQYSSAMLWFKNGKNLLFCDRLLAIQRALLHLDSVFIHASQNNKRWKQCTVCCITIKDGCNHLKNFCKGSSWAAMYLKRIWSPLQLRRKILLICYSTISVTQAMLSVSVSR